MRDSESAYSREGVELGGTFTLLQARGRFLEGMSWSATEAHPDEDTRTYTTPDGTGANAAG